jgi:hypothetical protein
MHDFQKTVASFASQMLVYHVVWSIALVAAYVVILGNNNLAGLPWWLAVPILSVLAIPAIFSSLRTFLYLAIFGCTLWLTPRTVCDETLIWLPIWLYRRLRGDTRNNKPLFYRDMDQKDLTSLVVSLSPGISEGITKDFMPPGKLLREGEYPWMEHTLYSAYDYLNLVSIAAIAFVKLPRLCMGQAEQVFASTLDWHSWVIPVLLGILVATSTWFLFA